MSTIIYSIGWLKIIAVKPFCPFTSRSSSSSENINLAITIVLVMTKCEDEIWKHFAMYDMIWLSARKNLRGGQKTITIVFKQ